MGISGSTDNPNPNPGEIVSIQVSMQNLGPEAATNAVVDLSLPDGLEYVSHSEGAGSYEPSPNVGRSPPWVFSASRPSIWTFAFSKARRGRL